MAKKDETYPAYFLTTRKDLVAITSATKMYKISPNGSNSGNQGVVIDHYITRNQVIKHYGDGERITQEDFERMYNRIFKTYLNHILP